jgi:hypothetical protein
MNKETGGPALQSNPRCHTIIVQEVIYEMFNLRSAGRYTAGKSTSLRQALSNWANEIQGETM